MSEAVAITSSAVALSEMNHWLNGFMQRGQNEGKLVLCGPKFMGIATGCYDPKYWPRLRGNAAQRRIKRRYLQRMWEVTKEGVESLRERLQIGDTPSRILGTW